MNIITRYISSQFKNPRGISGVIISIVQNVVNRSMYRKALELVNVRKDERVLDIGCGNGLLLSMINRKTAAELYGIDISEDAITMTIRRNKSAMSEGRLHVAVGDCCDLPYGEEVFSAITSVNTVYFWRDTVQGLREIKRTLKKGSSFYNIVYTKEYLNTIRYTQIGYKKFEPEELVEYGREAGFDKTEIHEIAEGKSLAIIYTK